MRKIPGLLLFIVANSPRTSAAMGGMVGVVALLQWMGWSHPSTWLMVLAANVVWWYKHRALLREEMDRRAITDKDLIDFAEQMLGKLNNSKSAMARVDEADLLRWRNMRMMK